MCDDCAHPEREREGERETGAWPVSRRCTPLKTIGQMALRQARASAEATPEHSLAHIDTVAVIEVVVIAISMPLWRQAAISSDNGSDMTAA